MVKLRLKRFGSRKKPTYRIVASDARVQRDGSFIELIGTYNPLLKDNKYNVNEDLAMKWLKLGAIPTDTVRSIFSSIGIMEKFHNSKNNKK